MMDKRPKAAVIETKVPPVLFSDHLPIISTIEADLIKIPNPFSKGYE
ncbi:MAG TPA: hypothetical protein VN040_12410 [Pseudosphingobacterium sp.]|nr:hypothetical protein [Pseudosphingobacterium sp.]